MSTDRFSSVRDVTATQRMAGVGCAATFLCAACHRSMSTTGRKAARILGLRTWVCTPCKPGINNGKGPKPKPMREMLLGKIGRAEGGLKMGVLMGRVAQGRRDHALLELAALTGEGLVFCMTRPAPQGTHAKRLFTSKEKGEQWQSESDGRCVQKPKPTRLSKKLAPLDEQASGRAWRGRVLAAGEAVMPLDVKPTKRPSHLVYSRHQVKPGDVVPSAISSAECRPWALQCMGGVA